MKRSALSSRASHGRWRSCWHSVPPSSGPGRLADGGDTPDRSPSPSTPAAMQDEPHRSPIALALSADGTAAADRQPDGRDRLAGRHARPGGCSTSSRPATSPRAWPSRSDGRRGVVTHWYGYDLAVLDIKDDKIAVAGRVEVGPEPRGVAIVGRRLDGLRGRRREQRGGPRRSERPEGHRPAGRRPRAARASPSRPTGRGCSSAMHGRRMSRSSTSKTWKVTSTIPIDGDNLRQVAISADGKTGYIANMRNRAVRRRPGTTSTWAGCSASA